MRKRGGLFLVHVLLPETRVGICHVRLMIFLTIGSQKILFTSLLCEAGSFYASSNTFHFGATICCSWGPRHYDPNCHNHDTKQRVSFLLSSVLRLANHFQSQDCANSYPPTYFNTENGGPGPDAWGSDGYIHGHHGFTPPKDSQLKIWLHFPPSEHGIVLATRPSQIGTTHEISIFVGNLKINQ